MRRSLAVAFIAVGLSNSAAAPEVAVGFVPVEIRISPIAVFKPGSSETHFGALTFLGGFAMHTLNGNFGSWSGLDFAPDGRLVSVADTGFWLKATLIEDGERPVGLKDAEIGVMLGDDGRPPPNKAAADAEGLRIVTRDGRETALVSFEQKAAVRAYRGPDFADAAPKRMPLPKFVSGIRRNQGLEGIAVAPAASPLKGATVLIAERSLDAAGNHRGFVLDGPMACAFAIRRSEDFDVSDANFLADGDLLILERRFSYSAGFATRIRRISAAGIRPGATLDGPVLIEADNSYQIDNMEGLAVRTTATGDTLLTLISDDNHGFLQRSILLQFKLAAPPLPAAKP